MRVGWECRRDQCGGGASAKGRKRRRDLGEGVGTRWNERIGVPTFRHPTLPASPIPLRSNPSVPSLRFSHRMEAGNTEVIYWKNKGRGKGGRRKGKTGGGELEGRRKETAQGERERAKGYGQSARITFERPGRYRPSLDRMVRNMSSGTIPFSGSGACARRSRMSCGYGLDRRTAVFALQSICLRRLGVGP